MRSSVTMISMLYMLVIPTILMVECSGQQTLDQVFAEREQMVQILANFAESQFANRCNLASADCIRSSYSACKSVFPNQNCDKRYTDAVCPCAGLMIDETQTSVYVPKTATWDSALIDQICYSSSFNPTYLSYFRNSSWADAIFFGSWNGMHRVLPALLEQTCGTYDPRFRPWYVAASSGPKDVVIVLDVSGSMGQLNRMTLAIEAAQSVLSTLTIADHVQVVTFSNNAQVIDGSNILKSATAANLNALKTLVSKLSADGGTNFEAAFTTTFSLLKNSALNDGTSLCNKAILFLTDGVATRGNTGAAALSNLIATQNAGVGAFIFTYSLGSGAETTLMKKFACDNRGIWQHVADGGDLRGQMSLFYDVFATGMSGGVNGTRFTAWVEPYLYVGGSGEGTTVASPVYDRTTNPPTLIGVQGIDLRMSSMQKIEPNPTRLLQALTFRSAKCPRLNLTTCQLESIRARHSVASKCGTCSNFTNTHPQSCTHKSYPTQSQVWKNENNLNVPWSVRTCCVNCTTSTNAANGKIVGVVVQVTIALLIVVVM